MQNKILCQVIMLPVTENIRNARHPGICMPNQKFINQYGNNNFPKKLVYGIIDNSERYNMTAKTMCSNGETYWNGFLSPQHLYLISDREIERGDYFHFEGKIGKFENSDYGIRKACKKIEATTDKSLGLPLIPQSFIKEYVSKQGKIDKVYLLHYKQYGADDPLQNLDNTVVILRLKESWNREEVKEIIKTVYSQFAGLPSELNKWFDENY